MLRRLEVLRRVVQRAARRPRGARSRSTGPLLVAFAAALVVPVLALGLALNHVYQAGTQEETLDNARASARLLAQTSVQSAVAGQDLERGLDVAGVADLGAAVDAAENEGRLVGLRLLAPSGTAVFPPQDEGLQPTGAGRAAVDAAVDGEVPARLTTGLTPPWLGGERVQVVEVYTAVVAPSDGRVLGVVRVLLPYDAVARRGEQQRRAFVAVLLGGLAALWGAVAVLAAAVTRRLRRQLVRTDHLAHHDPLTGLPNRALFRLRADEAITGAAVIAVIDLDRFKQVNDTLGHEAGDELLQVVGRRLSEVVRTDDTVARLGGDEFGLVLPGLTLDEASPVLERVQGVLQTACRVGGHLLSVAGSVGVAAAPLHGSTVEELLRQADSAMYVAKRSGRGLVATDAVEDAGALDELLMEAELAHALLADELVLHYQPLVELGSDDARRVEALVRWQHPRHGFVSPDQFLPLAESTGQIHALTWWVLRRALTDLVARPELSGVAVNVSPSTLADAAFAATVLEVLADVGVEPSRLTLEMTESAVVRQLAPVVATLELLHSAGVELSLDDFGQGSTSLAVLRQLPFREVKIDRAFVLGLDEDPVNRVIVRSVVDIAHEVGLRVVAEGVETEEILAQVRDLGCDVAQGYLLGRPVPLDRLASGVTPGATGGAG